MGDKKYIKIFTGSVIEVLSLKASLEEKNICPVIKDDAESARLSGFGVVAAMQEVFVREDELKTAKIILEKK